MTTALQRRYVSGERYQVRAEEDGWLRQRVAVFGAPTQLWPGYWEEIVAGAFDETLAEDDIRALFNHDPNGILGRTSAGTARFEVDESGLDVLFQAGDTGVGRDVAIWMERGDLDGGSIGFFIEDQEKIRRDDGGILVRIKKTELLDAGPVTFPAYPQTARSAAAAGLLASEGFDPEVLVSAMTRLELGAELTAEHRSALDLMATRCRVCAEEPAGADDSGEPVEEPVEEPAADEESEERSEIPEPRGVTVMRKHLELLEREVASR